MNKKLLFAFIILAHLLLFLSFRSNFPFWPTFTISFFSLSCLSIRFSKFDTERITAKNIVISISSGIILYMIFLIGKTFSAILFPDFLNDVIELYSTIKPNNWLHYIALLLIIIPGEELFWRGFVQKNLTGQPAAIIIAALLYTSANIYTGNILFILATLAGGLLWGFLYAWKKNIYLNIISHLVFDFLLLVILPIF